MVQEPVIRRRCVEFIIRFTKANWYLIIFSLFFATIILKNIPTQFYDLGGDSSQYIILAESISQGKGFRMINYPGEPFCTHYPPLFPLLLSSIIHFFGRNFYLMHLLVIFLGSLSLIFIYKIIEKYSDSKIAFFIICFFTFSQNFIIFSTQTILSDVPYLFFISFTLFVFAYYFDKESTLNREAWLVLLGLILSYLCRYIGLTLFLGIVVVLILNKKFKKLSFVSISFILCFFVWNIYGRLHSNPVGLSHTKAFLLIDNYAPYKGTLLEHPSYFIYRFIDGANYYSEIMSQGLFSYFLSKWSFLNGFLSLTSLGFILFGLWLNVREKKDCVFNYYFLFYLILIIFANHRVFGEGMRYILPILPFVIFYFFKGVRKLLFLLANRIGYFCFLILFLLMFTFNVISLPNRRYSYNDLSWAFKNFFALHYWVKENLHDDGIIISRKPTITYFYSGHKAIVYSFNTNPQRIYEDIGKINAKYVVIDEFSRETYNYLMPFIYRYREKLKLLYRLGNTGIFEVRANIANNSGSLTGFNK